MELTSLTQSADFPEKEVLDLPEVRKAKVILVGDSGVGKTSILGRYIDDTFMDRQIATIGVDFRQKTITMPSKR